ncbi:unnamed protein product, partial [Discosporangium mesarthrocarpum]
AGGLQGGGGDVAEVAPDRLLLLERRLLEACCVIMLARCFPRGAYSPESLQASVLAADALDTLCCDAVAGGGGLPGGKEGVVARALITTSAALRGLMFRLAQELPPLGALGPIADASAAQSPSVRCPGLAAGKALTRVAQSLCGGSAALEASRDPTGAASAQ